MYKSILIGCFSVILSGNVSGMFYQCYDRVCTDIVGIQQLIQSVRELPQVINEEENVSEIGSVIQRVKNKLLQMKNTKTGEITPEDAGTIVKQLKCKNGSLLFDDQTADSLISSFSTIKTTLLGDMSILQEQLSDRYRCALLLVLECFANACPGELTYSFDDEIQDKIIKEAYAVYEGVQ